MQIYRAKGLPDVLFVVDDGGRFWMIPQTANGWALRTRCKTDARLCERVLTPARRELDDGITSMREFYGLPANGFRAILAPPVDDDEAPAVRRAVRPSRTPPGRRSGLRSAKSLRV